MDLTLVETLSKHGPWAIVALLILAVSYLGRMYVKARDSNDAEAKESRDQMLTVLTDFTKNTERQTAVNEKVADILGNVERRLESVERAIQGQNA